MNRIDTIENMREVTRNNFYSYIGNFRLRNHIEFINVDEHNAIRFNDSNNSARYGVLVQSNPNRYYLPPARQ